MVRSSLISVFLCVNFTYLLIFAVYGNEAYLSKKSFKKSSLKLLGQFEANWTGMFFGWSPF